MTAPTLPAAVKAAISRTLFAHENAHDVALPHATGLDCALVAALAPLWPDVTALSTQATKAVNALAKEVADQFCVRTKQADSTQEYLASLVEAALLRTDEIIKEDAEELTALRDRIATLEGQALPPQRDMTAEEQAATDKFFASHFAPTPDAATERPEGIQRPPIGSLVNITGYAESLKVEAHTKRGFKYSGAVPLSIPKYGIQGDGTGEAFLDTGLVCWTVAALSSDPTERAASPQVPTPISDWQPPDEIVRAARDVDTWMQKMGCKEWQLGPCASRAGYLRLERELADCKRDWQSEREAHGQAYDMAMRELAESRAEIAEADRYAGCLEEQLDEVGLKAAQKAAHKDK